MKGWINILVLTILLLVVTYLFDSWWTIIFVPFLFMLLFAKHTFHSFFQCFLAGSITWFVFSGLAYIQESSIIADKISRLLINQPNGQFMLLLVAIYAGILAGFGGATGSSLRKLFVKEKPNYYY